MFYINMFGSNYTEVNCYIHGAIITIVHTRLTVTVFYFTVILTYLPTLIPPHNSHYSV